jgi:hypothetical protein
VLSAVCMVAGGLHLPATLLAGTWLEYLARGSTACAALVPDVCTGCVYLYVCEGHYFLLVVSSALVHRSVCLASLASSHALACY